jgi:hypothetical protein
MSDTSVSWSALQSVRRVFADAPIRSSTYHISLLPIPTLVAGGYGLLHTQGSVKEHGDILTFVANLLPRPKHNPLLSTASRALFEICTKVTALNWCGVLSIRASDYGGYGLLHIKREYQCTSRGVKGHGAANPNLP